MSDRRQVRVSLIDRNVYGSIIDDQIYNDDRIVDVIKWLTDILGTIPEANRESARISFEDVAEYDSSHIEMSIYYERDETDDEMASRVSEENRIAREQKAAQERSERMVYEALKKKFG